MESLLSLLLLSFYWLLFRATRCSAEETIGVEQECPTRNPPDGEFRAYFILIAPTEPGNSDSLVNVRPDVKAGYAHVLKTLSAAGRDQNGRKKKMCLVFVNSKRPHDDGGPRNGIDETIKKVECVTGVTLGPNAKNCSCKNCEHRIIGLVYLSTIENAQVFYLDYLDRIKALELSTSDYFYRRLGFPKKTEPYGCASCFSLMAQTILRAKIAVSIMKDFGWKKAAYIVPAAEMNPRTKISMVAICHDVFRLIKSVDLTLGIVKEGKINKILMTNIVGAKRSIVFICGPSDWTRKVVKTASELGFMVRGEYVFIDLSAQRDFMNLRYPWISRLIKSKPSEEGGDAYGSFMHITVDPRQFCHSMKELKTWSLFGRLQERFFKAMAHFWKNYNMSIKGEFKKGDRNASDGYWFNIPFFQQSQGISQKLFLGCPGKKQIVTMNGNFLYDMLLMSYDKKKKYFEYVREYSFTPLKTEYVDVSVKKAHSHILFSLWKEKNPYQSAYPPDEPACGINDQNCPWWIWGVPFLMCCILVLAGIIVSFRKRIFLCRSAWVIPSKNVFSKTNSEIKLNKNKLDGDTTISSSGNFTGKTSTAEVPDYLPMVYIRTGYYNRRIVALKQKSDLRQIVYNAPTNEIFIALRAVKEHIVPFYGIITDTFPNYIVSEYCGRGSLHDLLNSSPLTLNNKVSVCQDIARALQYLHYRLRISHGKLRSTNCLVDKNFLVRLSAFMPQSIQSSWWNPDLEVRTVEKKKKKSNERGFTVLKYYDYHFLWIAPELLRIRNHRPMPHPNGTMQGDIYSLGIIIHEVINQTGLFYLGSETNMNLQSIIDKLEEGAKSNEPPLRPCFDTLKYMEEENLKIYNNMKNLARNCWKEDPEERPTSKTVATIFNYFVGKDNMNLLTRVIQQSNVLEKQIATITKEHEEQKRKMETLLYQIMPRRIALQLLATGSAAPEAYSSATVLFTDMPNVAALMATMAPNDFFLMMNTLEVKIFNLIETTGNGLYKVDQISDSQILVCGITGVGQNHELVMATFAINLRNLVADFKIRGRPLDRLEMRFGLAKGPVIAAVIGTDVPKYSIFGDIVNVASRMQSTCAPMKIHVSEEIRNVIDKDDNFAFEDRGQIYLKGKGYKRTFYMEPTTAFIMTKNRLSIESMSSPGEYRMSAGEIRVGTLRNRRQRNANAVGASGSQPLFPQLMDKVYF